MASETLLGIDQTEGFIFDDEEFISYYEDSTMSEEILDVNEEFVPIDNANIEEVEARSVPDTRLAPFRFICKLLLRRHDGVFGGTGIFISPRNVLTAGHCILPARSNVRTTSIQVIPGLHGNRMPFGSQETSDFSIARKWERRKNRMFDYGLIRLPDNQLYNRIRGHFILSSQIHSTNVFGGGYADLAPIGEEYPVGQQMSTKGKLLATHKNTIYFSNELKVGYSGGPIYIPRQHNEKRYFSMLGLGCYLYRRNHGPRVNSKMIKELKSMIGDRL